MESTFSMIFAIANEKGGVAKTTTAVHLGHALARRGRRVLVVDIDPQSNATTWIGANMPPPPAFLVDVLKETAPIGDAIAPSNAAGVDLLWSTRATADADVHLRAKSATPASVLRRALRTITDQYDVILIDCAPGLGLVTLNGIVAANGIIAPIDSGPMALQGLDQLAKTVRNLVREEIFPKAIPITALITRYDGRTNVAKDVVNYFNTSAIQRFEVAIRYGTRVISAFGYKKTLFDFDPRDNVALDYADLAEELDLVLTGEVVRGQAS
jgi:chromosome partitioning protein